jgi:hypothetical protein
MSRPKTKDPRRHITATISSAVVQGIENFQKDDKNLTEDKMRPTRSGIIEDSVRAHIGPWIPKEENVVHANIKP